MKRRSTMTKLQPDSVDRVVNGFAGAFLGDPRRQCRLLDVSRQLARRPEMSIPAAMGSDAAVQGAYRLMNNPRVDFETLVASQADTTRQRAEEAKDVLVLHDTTNASFPDLAPEEIGYLNTGKPGFLIHLSLVVDAEGWRRPLGIVAAETLHRDKPRRAARNVQGAVTATWDDRESLRWHRGLVGSGEILRNCRSVVHIADRESDSYDLMSTALAQGRRFVFRVRVGDRRGRTLDDGFEGWSTVKQVAASCDGVLEREVALSTRKAKSAPHMNRTHPPRKGRMAILQFAATRVEIPRPVYLRDPTPLTLALNLVHVNEVDPPAGETPVEWLLYTTEAIDTADQIAKVVDAYRTRWLIEEFNAALKTGCAYEEREFESRHALLTMLALSLPIASEILAIRSRARTSPDAPVSEVLNRVRVELLRRLSSYDLPTDPTVKDGLLAVAALGGHLKRNGDPGWKVLQRGMRELISAEAGWMAAMALRDEQHL
jgi:hypothetical protein